jgi:hypothetical protein
VVIDRLRPTTPPTIYAKHNTDITVYVGDLSPFETLYLDWKSTTTSVPPDTFSAILAGVSPTVGKFTVLENHEVGFVGARGPKEISSDQNDLLNEIQAINPITGASPWLDKVKQVLQPVPGDVCSRPDINAPWVNPVGWKKTVVEGITNAIPTQDRLQVLNDKLVSLGKEIGLIADPDDKKTLTDYQTTIKGALDNLTASSQSLQDLLGNIKKNVLEPVPPNVTQVIHDAQPGDKNYQTQVWTLEYANNLASAAKRVGVAAGSYKPASALTDMVDAPTKVPISSITVQYQQPTRVEVSTGVMVPFLPYHSYAAAAVAANGVVTGNVVQETLTYTVVPVAAVNILAKEWSTPPQRTAVFGSIAVGYNPATSAVEFGTGVAFSWRSIVLSGMADIGRDTQLTGGFTVGQPLAASNPAKPLTTTVWGVKPAAELSVRIPLGGSGK